MPSRGWGGGRVCRTCCRWSGGRRGRTGVWLNFGHHHLGFTLGPVTGRLLAELMTGEAPFTDPAPYRADRF